MIHDLVFLIVGLTLIVFHDKLAKWFTRYQNRHFDFHFGESITKVNRLLNIVGGVIFLMLGLLGLAGVLPDFIL